MNSSCSRAIVGEGTSLLPPRGRLSTARLGRPLSAQYIGAKRSCQSGGAPRSDNLGPSKRRGPETCGSAAPRCPSPHYSHPMISSSSWATERSLTIYPRRNRASPPHSRVGLRVRPVVRDRNSSGGPAVRHSRSADFELHLESAAGHLAA